MSVLTTMRTFQGHPASMFLDHRRRNNSCGDCMTEAYTVGISETHIRNNATVFRVWQMIECGELTREEGLYLMVNTLADENHHLNQMCNDLIMRMPSRLLVETITGEK